MDKNIISPNDNKYLKWYWNICKNAKNRFLDKNVYSEKHHIYPKSIYGENLELVKLTAKEHYICHLLLWWGLRSKYGTQNNYTIKMSHAFSMMNSKTKIQKRYGEYNSEEYSYLKISYSENSKGLKRSEETKQKLSQSHKNQKPSEEMKKHLSEINSGENHPQYGTKHSEETLNKMRKPRSEQAKLNMKMAALKRIEKLKEEGKPLAWNTGSTVSEEERLKMSERMKGGKNPNFGKPRTPETVEKIRQSNIKTKNNI